MSDNIIDRMREEAAELLGKVDTAAALETLKIRFLGKKGELTALLKQMGSLPPEERPSAGKAVNELRSFIEEHIERRAAALRSGELNRRLGTEHIDVTLPGMPLRRGHKHVITQAADELCDIFVGLGYTVAEGPEVEYDYYNFEALNIPAEHPARDTQDTFYIDSPGSERWGDVLLRSQTSSVQIRVMQRQKPPIKIVCPGRVYRSDPADASHSPVFHQLEGLCVGEGVTMNDLRDTLDFMVKKLFGEQTRTRFRPHHFPFTEPSAEVDVSCFVCGGEGCRLCKGEGWIELLGSGMVHPNVLRMCGIDPDRYTGFAFGVGIDRIAMRKFGIDDMRLLFENNQRFLRQF